MTDETVPTPNAPQSNVTPIDRGREDVTPITKEAQTRRPPKAAGTPAKAKAATKATKVPAKKAAGTAKKSTAKKAATKAAGSAPVRARTEISKDGTQKDAFTGEVLPVTSFPTVKDTKTGKYERGTVARKNLEAYRAERRKDREKAKAKSKADKEKAAADKKAASATAKADRAAAKKAAS